VTALILLTLTGCYVFTPGSIDVTCDELSDCQDSAAGPDTGTVPPVLSLGAGYAAMDSDSWSILAHDSDQKVIFQRSGMGDFGGPFDYNPSTGRGIVATSERLYVFGPDADSLVSHVMPTLNAPIDIARASFGIIIATPRDILYQETPAEAPQLLTASSTVTSDYLSMVSDGDSIYLLQEGTSSSGVLYRIRLSDGITQLTNDFGENVSEQLGGGVFLGPNSALSFCSVSGEVYSLVDLKAGDATPVVVHDATSPVQRCAWDDEARRYLALQSDMTLVVTSADNTSSLQIALSQSGMAASSGHFFAE
jgi:hypothetical protein